MPQQGPNLNCRIIIHMASVNNIGVFVGLHLAVCHASHVARLCGTSLGAGHR